MPPDHPAPRPQRTAVDQHVELLPGLFQQRAKLVEKYVLELTNDDLLQNFELEAGLRKSLLFHDDASFKSGHWGWESPTSEVRGQFLGCWMMAAARFGRTNRDPVLQLKLAQSSSGFVFARRKMGASGSAHSRKNTCAG